MQPDPYFLISGHAALSISTTPPERSSWCRRIEVNKVWEQFSYLTAQIIHWTGFAEWLKVHERSSPAVELMVSHSAVWNVRGVERSGGRSLAEDSRISGRMLASFVHLCFDMKEKIVEVLLYAC